MKERVLSGIRPTGDLHWGHYFGVMQNWVELQKKYDCFYFVADLHALTSEYANTKIIKPSVVNIVADLLTVGIDPEKSIFFVQSHVLEHSLLHLLLSMVTPVSWLERVPSYKDMQQNLKDKDLSSYGFLGYPLLQTADILMYNASKVPVGEDQVAHIELAREIVRRFHFLTGKEVFIEPKPLLTKYPRIPGIDGRKMSKSFNNAIFLSDKDEAIKKKLMQTITDPARKYKNDPGHPEVCNIFAYHKLFTPAEKVEEIARGCRAGTFGCVDCKKICINNAITYWKPFQEKRDRWLERSDEMHSILEKGSKKARIDAEKIMQKVELAMGLR